MVYISVPVEDSDAPLPSSAFFIALLSAFLVGAVIGIFSIARFPAPTTVTDNELAAVVSVPIISDITSAHTNAQIIPASGEVAGADIVVIENTGTVTESVPAFADETAREEILAAAESVISDENAAISRISDQLERIKVLSVGVVTEFTQNCGNWKDDCAIPYQRQLDEYNNTYESLASELGFHMNIRSSAEATIAGNLNP